MNRFPNVKTHCLIVVFMVVSFYRVLQAEVTAPVEYDSRPEYEDQQGSIPLKPDVNLPDNDELDRTGGPDDFGYFFIDYEEPQGPDFNWVDIQITGNFIPDLADDAIYGPFPIGFVFPFYGIEYTEFYFDTNGYIAFSPTIDSYQNHPIPSTASPNNLIAFFWDDLNPEGGEGQAYYQTFSDTMLVLQVQNCPEWAPANPGRITCELLIFSDGRILMQYADFINNIDLAGATIGIENADGTIGLQYCYNNQNNVPPPGGAVLFYALNAEVSGTVTDSRTGLPINGALVEFENMSVYTDEDGYYELLDIFPGTFAVVIHAEGYSVYNETVLLQDGENTADFALDQCPPPGYNLDFEQDQGPFEMSENSIPGDWEWGSPGAGPGAGHSGQNVWATVLDGNHTGVDELGMLRGDSLISTMTWFVESDDYEIRYYHWLDYYVSGPIQYNGYNFQVSTDLGQTWELLIPDGGYPGNVNFLGPYGLPGEPGFGGNSGGWQEVRFPLDSFQDELVMFMFHAASYYYSSFWTYGVALDDFRIYGPPYPQGTISGTVTDAGTGEPVVGATVSVDDPNTQFIMAITQTDQSGDFTVTEVPISSYTVITDKAGYDPSSVENVTVLEDEETTVELEMLFLPYLINVDFDVMTGDVALTWHHNVTGDINEFIEFIVYRDETEIERCSDPAFFETLPFPQENGIYNYYYTISAVYDQGETTPAGPVVVHWVYNNVKEDNPAEVPIEWALENAWPNPFNPTVNVVLAVPVLSDIRVEIINLLGQTEAVINQGKLSAGYHTLTWNALNQPSGIYFLRTASDTGFNSVVKLMLIK